ELRAAARSLSREGGAPFFAFESHFADILARGGFDLVAGNPPWVRGERVPAQVRETLATRYATWRPARGRGFAHLPDLAVASVDPRGGGRGAGYANRASPANRLSDVGRSLEPAARCKDRCGRRVPGRATGTGDPARGPGPGPGAMARDAACPRLVDPRTRR